MAQPAPVRGDTLREVLRRFAAGVTVITSTGEGGRPVGMTATAFTSVSLDPAMVLVCVNASARTRHAIEGSTAYAVNVLAAGQEQIAGHFASKIVDKFEGVPWHPGATGAPLLDGALAWVECRVAQAVEAGTHIIYLGTVLAAGLGSGDPLVYYDADYRALGE